MNTLKERKRIFTYVGIGLLNTLIDVTIYLYLRHISVPIILANIVSTSVALTGSYLLNKRFTFQSNKNTKRTLPLFVTVTLIGLWGLQPLVIKAVVPILRAPSHMPIVMSLVPRPETFIELIAKLSATTVTLVWNYLLYKHVVFKDSAEQSSEK